MVIGGWICVILGLFLAVRAFRVSNRNFLVTLVFGAALIILGIVLMTSEVPPSNTGRLFLCQFYH